MPSKFSILTFTLSLVCLCFPDSLCCDRKYIRPFIEVAFDNLFMWDTKKVIHVNITRCLFGNSRTNIYINPPVAPPLVGGYGYGYGVPFFGGWGWSPFSFFAPGPSVAVGIGGGFDSLVFFLFLGAAAAVVRRFFGSRDQDDDY